MSSIINAAYWQRLFSMLSSNLIKMLRVKRNILIKIKFWSFVLKTLKYISIYRYFKLILNFRHGFKLLKRKTTVLRALVGKNQTYRGKGGKFDFFLILMLDRLGYN